MRVLLVTVVIAFGILTGFVQAKAQPEPVRHALVVGVSGYDAKIMRPLKAPENDVRLIFDLLGEHGFEQSNIQVLADKIAEGKAKPSKLAVPTRQNIVAAFETLTNEIAKRKNEKHFVFVYFSGHGSRQPQIERSDDVEPDNFDEVFLPIDVGQIDFASRKIKNGLVDDEIRELLHKLRTAGDVFVWAVFDACHAGDMTRGIEKDVQAKFVDPMDLVPAEFRDQWRDNIATMEKSSLPETVSTNASQRSEWLGIDRNAPSNIAVFAAAEADKLALELRIAEADNRVFSAFTYHLVKAIKRSINPTYRSLASGVDREYAAFQADLPTPVYEGVLDHSVAIFNQGQSSWRWPAQLDAKTNSVKSGLGALSGVGKGSILAVHSSASTGPQPVGYLTVTESGLNNSTAVPTEFSGLPEPSLGKLQGPLTLSIAKRSVPLVLRVATSLDENTGSGKIAMQAIKLLQKKNDTTDALQLSWVAAGEQADVHLRATKDRLSIAPRTSSREIGKKSDRFAIDLTRTPELVAEELRENLWRLTRQKNLLRIAAALTPANSNAPIEIRLFRISSTLEKKHGDDHYACPDPDMAELNEGGDLVDATEPAKLKHCDVLRLEVSNTGSKRIQVTGILVGSDASVSVFDVGNRPIIKPQNILNASSLIQILTWCAAPQCEQLGLQEGEQSVGRERLLLLVFELPDGSSPVNLSYLAQPSLSKATAAAKTTFRRQTSQLERLLGQAGLLPKTRAVNVGNINDATLKFLQWDIVR